MRTFLRRGFIAFVLGALVACGRGEPQFRATDITGAQFGRSFELTDHTGKTRRLADFRGKVVVLFFGYTHCPDLCPTTLAEIAAALKKLGPEQAQRVQVLLATVDPERDTPEVLRGYVTAFDPSFLGLTGSDQQIAAAAKEFKVIYQKVPGDRPGSYSMDHSAGTYVFDSQGRLRLFVSYGQGADVFAHDIRALLETG